MEMMNIVCIEYIGEFSNTHFRPGMPPNDVLYNVNDSLPVIHL